MGHCHPLGHRYILQHCHPLRRASSPTGHCHRVPAPVLAASSLLLPHALPAQGHDGCLWLCLLGDRNPFCLFCLLRDMGISWLCRDQIILPCLGTGSLSACMGTSSFVPDQGRGVLATQGECATQPAWGHGHFHQLGDSSPLYLLPAHSGTWASSGSLGTETHSASSACLGTWASPGSLGQDHFCQHSNMRIFWLLRNRILSACLGTWPLSTAWGQECSLLSAGLLGNMAVLWIPGDQITAWGQDP